MGDPTGISGAVLGALLAEVVQKAKLANRCQENCNNLVETLEFASPTIYKLVQSPPSNRSVDIEKWLIDFEKILENAKEVVSHCKPCSWTKTLFTYRSRVKLSKSLMGINEKINARIAQLNLLQFGMIEETHHCLTMKDMAVGEVFKPQPIPNLIVAFEGNPFEKLLGHIVSESDVLCGPMTIGLKGQGGMGKTLLAKMIYNDSSVQEKFGRDCMIYVTVGHDAIISSLYKVIAKTLEDGGVFDRDYAFRKEEDQRSYLQGKLLKKKVLLILDDIWDNGGITQWLDIAKGPGSVTLVTTRNKVVLSNMKADVILDMQSLSKEQSWELFSYHAFGSKTPSIEIVKVAQEICAECDGLPLALEVIGSSMWEKVDVRVWRTTLSHMKKSQQMCNSGLVEERVFNCLRYSYDEMDEVSKKCFLYVAAYPEDYEIPIKDLCTIWLADDIFEVLDVEEGMELAYTHLTSLVDRSMIQLDKYGRYMKVHDILRDLAIRIICGATSDEWASECYFHAGKVLEKLPKMERRIKRMSLVGSTISELPLNVKVPELRVCLLSKLQVGNDIQSLKIPNCFFRSMKKLQLLDMGEIQTLGRPSVALLDALYSVLPNFETLQSLRRLNLSGCGSLKNLPESIGELKSLRSFDFSNCRSLEALPERIGELKSLTCLKLDFCVLLKGLPTTIGELKSLTSLDLVGCSSLKALPERIGELKSLTHLNLGGCESLKGLPTTIGELKFLTRLDLLVCISLEGVPASIGGLKSLTSLNLVGCNSLKGLPESIGELKSLTSLDLQACKSLEALPESIGELMSLRDFYLSQCESLDKLPESIGKLDSLTSLFLDECISLKELPRSIKDLKCLENLSLPGCNPMYQIFESVSGPSKSLGSFGLSDCASLKALPPSMKELKSLTQLSLSRCKFVNELLESIKGFKSLTSLILYHCDFFEELHASIGEMKSLTSLKISECGSLKRLPKNIGELKSLTNLSLSWCRSLEELPESIGELKSLTSLNLSGCNSLKALPECIKELKCLTSLYLYGYKFMKDLPKSIKHLNSIKTL